MPYFCFCACGRIAFLAYLQNKKEKNMIFITGDTHIPTDVQKLNSERFPEQKELTERDYLIICGDFGGVIQQNI